VTLRLTEAGRDLGARRQRFGRRRPTGLGLRARHQLLPRGQVAGQRRVGPGQVVIVIMVAAPRRSADVTPGSVAAVVEAAEEVEALRVDVEVQDHHDEEVEQAEQQDAFADALQGPAQHQPGHGRGRRPPASTALARRGYRHALIPMAAIRYLMRTCGEPRADYLTSAGVMGSPTSIGRLHSRRHRNSELPACFGCVPRFPA